MLVLARRLHERIIIPAIGTAVEVTAARADSVRLGIEAPPEVAVLREEVYRRLPAQVWASLPPGAGAEARLAQTNLVWRHRLHNLTLGLALLRQQLPAGMSAEVTATIDLLEGEASRMCQEMKALAEPAATSKGPGGGNGTAADTGRRKIG